MNWDNVGLLVREGKNVVPQSWKYSSKCKSLSESEVAGLSVALGGLWKKYISSWTHVMYVQTPVIARS